MGANWIAAQAFEHYLVVLGIREEVVKPLIIDEKGILGALSAVRLNHVDEIQDGVLRSFVKANPIGSVIDMDNDEVDGDVETLVLIEFTEVDASYLLELDTSFYQEFLKA